MSKKFVAVIVIVTLILLAASVLLANQMLETAKVEPSQGAQVVLKEDSYNWGEIGLNDGRVEKEFVIENEGSQVLKLFNVKTSCACTTAQFIGEKKSPLFGMHSKSAYVRQVEPGDKTRVKVVFDPAYHGPGGVGPVTRQVTIETNDEDRPKVELFLTAMVVKNK